MDKIDETELGGLIASEIAAAKSYDASDLSSRRASALEYYQGILSDLPAMDGRSSATSRDLSDTIGWMLPGIIRVFTASDNMASFEPERKGDEAFCQQATDYVNFVFWKDNDGYRTLYDCTHNSLLHGNGIGKTWWDDSEICEYSEHRRITQESIALFSQDEGVEILAVSENETPDEIQIIGPDGQAVRQQVPTYDVKIKRESDRGRLKVVAIAPEDFLIDPHATCLDDARFLAHREITTRSALIEMGFSREDVEDLPSDGKLDHDEEQLARQQDRIIGVDGKPHSSQELIEIFECYIKADADGDGVSETVRVMYAGDAGSGKVLDWEVCDDEHPFFNVPCKPVPHRFNAQSIADDTMDIQRIKTALIRGALDNLYHTNLPTPVIEQDSIANPDALINPEFGNPIFLKKGRLPPQWQTVPFVAGNVLDAVSFFDGIIEKRTGVSRTMMALDPEALQNQSATANQNAKDSAYSQVELVARNMAELGWRPAFRKMLRLVVKNQDRSRMIRLRDEWVEMDPRHWNANMDCAVNVGLGTGSRDRDMAMLNGVLANQVALSERMAQVSPAEALKMLPRVLNTMRKIAESAGLKDVDQYFPDYGDAEVSAMAQQMQAAGQQVDPKVEAEIQMKQAEAQMRSQEMQAKMELERMRLHADMELKREQLSAEMALKREQLSAELALKREMGFVGAYTKAATTPVRMGGEPG